MKRKGGNMLKTNEATDTDPCLILAEPAPYLIRGTSLKVIYPVRKNFLMGLKDSSNSAGSGGILR
ncbi:MAG TPA: hypothetical protein DCY98_06060 [Nitrospinae bacterium]|nr:hypothetical protein [Nitrospinota bacterium]